MAKPVWQQKLQAKLDAAPLYFVGNTHVVKHDTCLEPGDRRGRKVTLRYLTNYTGFNVCAKCKVAIH